MAILRESSSLEGHRSWRNRLQFSEVVLSSVSSAIPKRKVDGEAGSSSSTPKRSRKNSSEEKRLARFVNRPSVAVRECMERAYVHRLYLIEKMMMAGESGCEFFVVGVTGNVYSVKVEKRPSCTCPDAAKGNL